MTYKAQTMRDDNVYVDANVPFDKILEFYSIRYLCGNCQHYGFVSFKKGVKKHWILCSKCECLVTP